MHIQGRWHQIFGAQGGKLLSTQTDCNAFGLSTRSGLIMFDAGSGSDPDAQQRALVSAGFGAGPLHLFLTHGHADHSGGAAALVSAYGTRLDAGDLTAKWLAAGDEERISLTVARRAGIYPPAYRYRPAVADRLVEHGVPIRIDDVLITPIATPGHSADHFSYLVSVDGEAVLVGGDALFEGGTVVLQDTWDCSVSDSCRSIRRLSTMAFDTLLPGHGPWVTDTANCTVALAMQRIERLLPPLNFL